MISLKRLVPVALMMIMMAIASVASAQYYHEERLDKFLDGHPKAKAELNQNPDLIYDKQWREKHPELRQFMQNHPDVWGKLPNSERHGAYGPNHQWHEADTYHEHNAAMDQNHPEHPNSGANGEQNAELSKHQAHVEAKEAKHHQHEDANAVVKADHPHKHHAHGQN